MSFRRARQRGCDEARLQQLFDRLVDAYAHFGINYYEWWVRQFVIGWTKS